MTNKNILVLGSNSFSGSSFIKYALEQADTKITGASRSEEPNDVFLPYKWGKDSGAFDFHQLDLNKDLDKIMALIQEVQPSYIVNFAAQSMVGQSWDNPEDWFQTNAVSTISFQNRLRKEYSALKKYVHITTPEVYGSTSGWITEDTNFNPSTPYAVSRAAGDMSLKTFYNEFSFPVIMTRAANVYGPGQQLYRIIPRTIMFIKMKKKLQLHGGGISTRSFIHIDDVSSATWKIMMHGNVGESYHISTQNTISIKDLVTLICQKMNVDFNDVVDIAPERAGKDDAYMLESQKLRTSLNWEDHISLAAGIEDCIEWVEKNYDILLNQEMNYIHKP